MLVATKLRAPSPRQKLVARVHLTHLLDRARQTRLTLLSAPPGFGKTSLVVEWLQQSPMATAWVALDEGDNDPVRFWSYVIQALTPIYPGLGQNVFSSASLSPSDLLEQTVIGLINTISSAVEEAMLVLDDYHVVDAPAIHQSVTFLLQRLPPHLHVVIISRVDPPLSLGLLRARDELLELRASDLRFTGQEAADFLSKVMGVTLSARDLEALEAHTEGWPAGLQLAALGMRGRQNIPDFIASFKGVHRFMLDYLTEEVLQRQSEEIQTFLLHTSILDRLTAPLVEEVTEQSGGQAMLERIEQSNLFLIPLDEERGWYRYHHLFGEYLGKCLQQRQPGLAPRLHRRAARWYDAQGLVTQAISHALDGEDVEHAATLIGRIAEATLMRGEMATLQGWLDALPVDLVLRRPDLCLFQAWLSIINGRMEVSQRFVEAAFRGLSSGGSGEGAATSAQLSEIAVIRSFIAVLQADYPQLKERIAQLLPQLPETGPFVRSFRLLAQGFAHDFDGDTDAAAHDYLAAGVMSREHGNLLAASLATSQMGDLSMQRGQLHRAAEAYQQALDLLIPGGQPTVAVPPLLLQANAEMGLGALRYEWNQLAAARQVLERAVELGRHYDHMLLLGASAVHLARVRMAQGDDAGAREALQEATRAIPPSGGTIFATYIGVYVAMLELMAGDLDAATRWALDQEHGHTMDALTRAGHDIVQIRELQNLGMARVLIAQSNGGRALGLLADTETMARSAGHMTAVVQALALQSLALAKTGHHTDREQALECLSQALILAESEGYIRTFVDEGAPMATLLTELRANQNRQLAKDGALPLVSMQYLDRLLDVCGQPVAAPIIASSGGGTTPSAQQLIEPLTKRELDILRLVNRGLSDAEVAQELVLSVGTVHWHMKNIYGKLEVHRRTQAIVRARDLGLL